MGMNGYCVCIAILATGASGVLALDEKAVVQPERELAPLTEVMRADIERGFLDQFVNYTWDSFHYLEMKYAGFDTASYLIALVKDSQKPMDVRQRALGWLTVSNQPGARDFVVELFDALVEPHSKVWSRADAGMLRSTLTGLGASNTEAGTERLIEFVQPEFWQSRQYTEEGLNSQEKLSLHLRRSAIQALAMSNTRKAMEARKHGRHIPKDLREWMKCQKELGKNWESWKKKHPELHFETSPSSASK